MPATIPDLLIPSDSFVSINDLSNIPIGSSMLAQIKSNSWVRLIESSTQPPATSTAGLLLTSLQEGYATFEVRIDSLEIWAICIPSFYNPNISYASMNVQLY